MARTQDGQGGTSIPRVCQLLPTVHEKYLQKAAPLTNLTKKEQPFWWDDKHQRAFNKLKRAFANSEVLYIFNPELATEVETDTSDGAIGACLGQRKDKKLLPVAFYSQKLAPAELNYKLYDQELLAIVDALKQWRDYLEGSKAKVKVYMDHKNLKSFTSTKVLNRRQVRWPEELAAYNFRIYYQKGSLNGQADTPSRRADYITNIPKTAGQILEVEDNGNLAYHQQQIAATFEISDPEGEQLVQEALVKDKAMKDLCTPNQEPGSPFKYKDRILWFNSKCYVPKSARDWVIWTCHDDRVQGHQGIKWTLNQWFNISTFHVRGTKWKSTSRNTTCANGVSTQDIHHMNGYSQYQQSTNHGKQWHLTSS